MRRCARDSQRTAATIHTTLIHGNTHKALRRSGAHRHELLRHNRSWNPPLRHSSIATATAFLGSQGEEVEVSDRSFRPEAVELSVLLVRRKLDPLPLYCLESLRDSRDSDES